MEDLSSSWRKVNAPEEPKSDDEYWINTTKKVFEVLEALDLSKPVPKLAPKKRGRPKKKITESKPKRPRGRPRKKLYLLKLYSPNNWETFI